MRHWIAISSGVSCASFLPNVKCLCNITDLLRIDESNLKGGNELAVHCVPATCWKTQKRGDMDKVSMVE
jgi:hypothetical protein